MYQCTRCGFQADPITGCPACGQPPPPLAVEIDRLNREIAEMSARDLAIQRERANLSARMQAALHQRNLLSGAQAERIKQAPKQRGGTRRRVALISATVRSGRRGGAKRTALTAGDAPSGPPQQRTPLGPKRPL